MARARLVTKKASLVMPGTLATQTAVINLTGGLSGARVGFKVAQIKCEMVIFADNIDDEINYRKVAIFNQLAGKSSAGTEAQLIHNFIRCQWKYTQTAVGVAGYLENFPYIWTPPSNFILYGEQMKVEFSQNNCAATATVNVTVYGFEIALTELEYTQNSKLIA